MQTAFQIHQEDNVATALEELKPGEVRILGEGADSRILACETIPAGHKLALTALHPGQAVIKYGTLIGQAVREIAPGSWVHLHCMKSLYDERSSHLDVHTGAPNDTRYE